MATSFDDLTLGEVEEITNLVLGGKPFSDPSVDPLMLAGGVMWVTNRKVEPQTWDHFKNNTKMSAIKEFATQLDTESDDADPTNGHNVIVT
jgi:hypothetical protein